MRNERNEPLIFLHLKLVAKVSVGVGAIAVLSLLISLMLISGQTDDSYLEVIRSNSITRAHLGRVMSTIGLMLVAIAGIITWLIVLYSSFRIVGPLYRFTQNLKLAGDSDSAALIGLRQGDAMQEQEENIKIAVAVLREHYTEVEAVSRQAAAALDESDAAAYAGAVARLKALDEKVRV
jgi:hypothetical protein